MIVKHAYTNAMKYRALAKRAKNTINQLKDSNVGRKVLILGTGPSLNDIELERINVDAVIYLNNAVTIRKRIKNIKEYVVITDFLRMTELRPQLISDSSLTVLCSSDKIFNPNIDSKIFDDPFLFIYPKVDYEATSKSVNMAVSPSKLLSEDILEGIYLGKSVVFPAIQIASYLGFSSMYLGGVDMNPNEKVYFNENVRGNWSGFNYETDGKEHMRNCANFLMKLNKRLYSLGYKGVNKELARLPVEVIYE
ncbi:hypothetical protein [Aliiglaciecola lipolytica]|uniref:hypothetical protein n=1 Tax=Aliiglaciecola lipolytica TaxID=477689 RepID=UPI001C08F927|nr:hypothetical protein [Aliiglaciecola lipolytica]MBU2877758.1 hypothetical protein [Aliiglaciecola lipolytica]